MSMEEDFFEDVLPSGDEEHAEVKYATVTGLFENGTAKIQFDGEDTPSEKQYAYLSTYFPNVGDRVEMLKWRNAYILQGKLRYGEPPEGSSVNDYVTMEDLKGYAHKEALDDYVKRKELDAYATVTDLGSYEKAGESVRKASASRVSQLTGQVDAAIVANRLNQ